MADQGMDYLPDWSDLAWPTCPECINGAVVIDTDNGRCAWLCLACGHRWTDGAKEAERAN